jgi:hypothetical protein
LVEAEPHTILSTVKALVKASRDLSADPEGWVKASARRRPEVDREEIMKLWQQSQGHWPVNGRLDDGVVEGAAAMLVESGQVSAVPSMPVEEWVEMRFVDSALRELGRWKEP